MSVGTRLRLSLIDGPELRCAHCGDFWAITPEFWVPGKWAECRACSNERSRLYQALRRKDPAFRANDVERGRRYRKWVREHAPDYLEAYDRERQARHRQWLRDYRARSAVESYPCACGLTLNAKSAAEITRTVQRHNATVRHRRWREQQELLAALPAEDAA